MGRGGGAGTARHPEACWGELEFVLVPKDQSFIMTPREWGVWGLGDNMVLPKH